MCCCSSSTLRALLLQLASLCGERLVCWPLLFSSHSCLASASVMSFVINFMYCRQSCRASALEHLATLAQCCTHCLRRDYPLHTLHIPVRESIAMALTDQQRCTSAQDKIKLLSILFAHHKFSLCQFCLVTLPMPPLAICLLSPFGSVYMLQESCQLLLPQSLPHAMQWRAMVCNGCVLAA